MATTKDSTSAARHGQRLHEQTTASRCVTETFTATHNFEVTDFSLLHGIGVGQFVSSSTFTVGGYDWNINVYPDGFRQACDEDTYVSVFLFLRGEEAAGVRAKYNLSLVDKHGEVSKLPRDGDSNKAETATFYSDEDNDGWGYNNFIDKHKLRPFLCLNDDSLTIRCVLTVLKSRTEDVSNEIISVPPANLHQDLGRMLKDGKGADVTFQVDGQMSRAHRCVLSARSPVLDAEFFGPLNRNSSQPIKINDMDPTIFEGLLHFIYTDSLPDSCNSDENTTIMQHLLVAADRYGLERLKAMCESKLLHGIDVQTVATTLALAEQHNCEQLKYACVRFIASQDMLSAIMNTDGFEHLEQSCPLVTKKILDETDRVKRRRTSMQQLCSC